MSNSNTHKSASFKNSTHTFPDLKGGAKEGNNKSTDSCTLFKPMFNKPISRGKQKQSGIPTAPQTQREDALTQASRRGYERGFEAGQSDGCELVQNQLEPIIDDIKQTLLQYDECRQRLSAIYGANGLELALAIVEKISGEPVLLELEDLSEVESIVHQALQESFGLNLHFNPQDYQFIETMSACNSPLDWNKHQQVAIIEDDAIKPGSVSCSAKQMEWDSIYKQVALALGKVMAANNQLQIE